VDELNYQALQILVMLAVILSVIFYSGSNLFPWYVGVTAGFLSVIAIYAAGVYWIGLEAATGVPEVVWFFNAWLVLNLILVFYAAWMSLKDSHKEE
jgi:hypothetical protein